MSGFGLVARLRLIARAVRHTRPRLTARVGQSVWSYANNVPVLLVEKSDPVCGVSSEDRVCVRQTGCCAVPRALITAKWVEKDVIYRSVYNVSDDLHDC
jgi:hypothetical protein